MAVRSALCCMDNKLPLVEAACRAEQCDFAFIAVHADFVSDSSELSANRRLDFLSQMSRRAGGGGRS